MMMMMMMMNLSLKHLLKRNKCLTPAIQTVYIVMYIIGLLCVHTQCFISHDVSVDPCKNKKVMFS